MSFLSKIVEDREFVFRGIVDKPEGIFDRHGKLATGCLKQSTGVSVDRDGNRTDKEVIDFMVANRPAANRKFVKFLKMNVGNIRSHEWRVDAAPLPTNEFHAEMDQVVPSKHLNQENARAIIDSGKIIDAGV
ncbi:MAG: hypothetical protein HUK20_09800 [Fibrobacter sp.]|nr:hypothetical protein [Fibrobacter sp.]